MSNALDRVQQAATNVAFMDHYHPDDDTGNVSVRKHDLALLIALAELARPLTIIGDRWVARDEYNDHDAREFNAALAALKQEAP